MAWLSTDRDWEQFGQQDPYWAVLTEEKFRGQHLNTQAIDDFFTSGQRHVEHLFARVRKQLDPDFAPQTALDFGCGVGRLVLPLAQRCERVVGVDISPSMLAEAKRNCDRHEIRNCHFVQSDDRLSGVSEQFDLVHSTIVFQHIPPARGRKLFTRLVELLGPGGAGVLHLTYSRERFTNRLHRFWPEYSDLFSLLEQWARRFGLRIKAALRKIDPTRRWRTSKPALEMQMNPYLLNPLFHTLQAAGVTEAFRQFRCDHGQWGVVLYFRKPNPRR